MKRDPDRIVLAVTSAQSMRLLDGFPDYLVSRGWDVHVVCSDPPSTQTRGWQTHGLPMRRQPSPWHDLISLGRWVRLLLALRPTLVVAGTPKAGLLGMIAAALTRTPRRIYLLRGLRLSSETGRRRALLAALERIAMAAATDVQSVSQSLRREAVELGLVPSEKIVVVGAGSSNGVAVPPSAETRVSAEIRRGEFGIPNRPTIGFVGRMHTDKGLPALLAAFTQVASQSDAQLLLIGPEEPAGYLHQLLDGLDSQVRNRVIWTGPVDEPAPYYRTMDALTLPTKREGFPNVVLEAAAHAVPTIASDVTGCRDSVIHRTTGLLVPINDNNALARAMCEVINEPDSTRNMGARARDRAQRDFSRPHVWAQINSFYRSSTNTN